MPAQSFNEEFIGRLADGDAGAEREFVEFFGDLLRIKLRSKLRSPQRIDDVRQEVFLRVLTQLRHKGGIKKPESLGAFVHTVCNNVLLETFRLDKRTGVGSSPERENDHNEPQHPAEPVDRTPTAESGLISEERRSQVRVALDTMAQRDRQVLRAVFLEERERTDVCREFDITPENLRVLLHRAKSRFRQAFVKTARAG